MRYLDRNQVKIMNRYRECLEDIPDFLLPAFRKMEEEDYSPYTLLFAAQDFLLAASNPDWDSLTVSRRERVFYSMRILKRRCNHREFGLIYITVPYDEQCYMHPAKITDYTEKEVLDRIHWLAVGDDGDQVPKDEARDRIIFLFLHRHGLTTTELSNINLEDFSHDYTSVYIYGTHRREVIVAHDLAREIADYIRLDRPAPYSQGGEGNSALLVSRKYVRLTPSGIQRVIRKILPGYNPRMMRKALALKIYAIEGLEGVRDDFGLSSLWSAQRLVGIRKGDLDLLDPEVRAMIEGGDMDG